MFNPNVVPAISAISSTAAGFNPYPFDPGFDIQKVVEFSSTLPEHSWEFGTLTEALLEIFNPELSVYGDSPFPVPTVNMENVRALSYLESRVDFGTGYSALDKDNEAAGDPASMGVAAVLLGKTNATFATAANETQWGLLNQVPRFTNGAISHRISSPNLWADFVYMAPPFLAYYSADTNDEALMKEAVRQCGLYREILQANTNETWKGVWHHIIGPENQDLGLWSTGNGWAAAGMTRVLATVTKAPLHNLVFQQEAIDTLTQYIKEIIDGAMQAPREQDFLRNYLDNLDTSTHGYGEISGSSLIAATIYRMAVLRPSAFGQQYIEWADGIRKVLCGKDAKGNPHITSAGIVTPAVNPLNWRDNVPFTSGSPEGNSFVILLYAGWRDCVKAGKCIIAPGPSLIKTSSGPSTFHHRSHMHFMYCRVNPLIVAVIISLLLHHEQLY